MSSKINKQIFADRSIKIGREIMLISVDLLMHDPWQVTVYSTHIGATFFVDKCLSCFHFLLVKLDFLSNISSPCNLT